MYAPEWVCWRLGLEAKLLRLGWAGRPPHPPGVLNPGDFCLVGLFQPQYYYDKGLRAHFFKQFWGLQDVLVGKDATGKPVLEEKHCERGPIFSRFGDTRFDYDPAQYIPVLLCRLPIDSVISGSIAMDMPRMLWETKQATKANQLAAEKCRKEAKAKEANKLVGELSQEAHEYAWWKSNQTGAETTNTAKKHMTEAREQIRACKDGEFAITPEDV